MQYVKRKDHIRARLCKLAFESLYGPLAWAYDWVSRTFFLGQWRLWQRAALPHVKGPRVLEVGMGTGDLQPDLLEKGFEAWGIDASSPMLRRARGKVQRLGLPIERLLRARAQSLPFPEGYFNSVVSTFPSEYIADPQTLSELSRVLAPGGRLVIVPGGWLKPRGAKARTLEGIARVVYGYESSPGEYDAEAIQRRLVESEGWHTWIGLLRQRMEEAGFKVSARIASNSKGSCLVVIAEASARQSSSATAGASSQ
jgi:ubiquinone/menaquinone biosynthesis C-methylase UbiE